MKLTKKIESEIKKFLQTYWDTYFEGNIEKWESFLTKEYKNIGTNQEEIWNSKSEILDYTYKVLDQLVGNAKVRNKKIQIISYDPYIMTHELGDLYIKTENEWTFYAPIRLSSLIQKQDSGWTVLHQHGSFPDAKTQKGEAFAVDAIKAENVKLQKAIEKSTIELKEKNRELEVEGALERIRAQAVAMKESSDLLDIVVSMRNEFIKLGHEAHYFWHMMWLPKTYEKAMTSGDGSKIGFVMELPRHIHGDIPLLAKWEKSKKQTVVYAMNVEEALSYIDIMVTLGDFQNIDPQAPTEDDIRHIGGLTFIMARTSHGEIGYSLPGVVKNPPKEDIDILVKFAGAFDLAHQRCLDLQKAEKQRREVEVELALEKVRSRTMAMQHSDELQEASFLLDEQVRSLGIKTWGCAFNIYREKDSTEWFGNAAGVLPTYTVPRKGIFKNYYQKGQKGDSLYIQEFSGKDCVAHYEYMSSLPVIGDVLKNLKKTNNGFPTYQIDHVVYFKYGYLLFITKEHVPDAHDIFKRFAKVFEQTYTRFLDLQKAEAQAKEARIETALEKVRSRSLAMQNSEELKELIGTVYKELNNLDMALDRCLIWIMNDADYSTRLWMANREAEPVNFYVPNHKNPPYRAFIKGWKDRDTNWEYHLKGKVKKDWDKFVFEETEMKNLPEKLKMMMQASEQTVMSGSFHSFGCLQTAGPVGLSEEQNSILTRFAKVFNQAYTRFSDLKKAEAQAREAQIEAALERVRSKAMAMHSSEDLSQTVNAFFNELKTLGLSMRRCGVGIVDVKTKIVDVHVTTETHTKDSKMMTGLLTLSGHPVLDEIFETWTRQEEYHPVLRGKQLTDYYKTVNSEVKYPNFTDDNIQYGYYFHFKEGGVFTWTDKELTDGDLQIFRSYTSVLSLTYRRHLDLKEAETQAREAQIEASLERVRSQAMAMRQSNDLENCTRIVFDELEKLNLSIERSGIGIFDPETRDCKLWSIVMAQDGTKELTKGVTSLTIQPMLIKTFKSWRAQKSFSYVLEGKELENYYKQVSNSEFILSEDIIGKSTALPKEFYHYSPFSAGGLYFFADSKPSEEDKRIIRRFAEVFDLTYTRYEDLQKAEAQTREAQINLAVERVRAKALAMHKSEEIMSVVAKLKDEVMSLDIPDVVAATIFLNEGDDKVRMWDLSTLDINDKNGYEAPFDITFKLKKTDPHLYVKRVWENTNDYFIEIQNERDFRRIIAWLRENNQIKVADEVEHYTESTQLKQLYHAVKKLNNGKLVIDLMNPPSEEMETILTKMGAAFDLAYKRFEDLQKAEAQTREALIEAALEKVRSRSLAMHNADELGEVVLVIVEKLTELGVILDANGITLCTYFPDSKDVLHWIASLDFGHVGKYLLPYFDHVIFKDAWQSKEKGDAYFSKGYSIQEKNSFFEHAFEHSDYKHFPEEFKQWIFKNDKHILSFAWQKNSALLIPSNTGVLPTEDEKEILIRFSKVFEQAYIRFMDLQTAEMQTRQAQIEGALERVRARALAMQNPEELKDVAKTLRTEMGLLGVEELETCSIYINDDETSKTECWYALKDIRSKKKKLVNDHFKLNLNDTWVGKQMLKFYKAKNDKISIVMTGNNRKEWIDYCEKHSKPFQGYYGKEIPDRTYHLYKFSHGAIGVATAGNISEEHWNLLKRAASVFSLAYSRFKDLTQARFDLQRLKEEKQKAEDAFSELQLTQKQLIQSEKMASLGELTAGIAHEIQNPLNFVNNFSEVSKELLDEMLEELKNGDMEEVKAIMDDVIQNLEKINHHGKRADGIVKGMLQHSRASGDKKEPTDINALTDEYFRLAYHGLRAKDKSFNAHLETSYDKGIKTINVIPQDIGRVILNLFTNAFYAVDEKKSNSKSKNYKPTVSVRTKKLKDKVEISVRDNGNGIPKTVIDKIFQPFFTTKPTGKGTGLGLSMSYDIIKSHHGTLIVETEDTKYTEFKIFLPTTKKLTL